MLDQLDESLATATTRRTVLKTGAKLAYAAPIVAMSFQVSQRGAGAVTPVGGGCFHSINAQEGKLSGCQEACTAAANCTGELCDGFGGPADETPGPCEDCNLPGNECPSTDYCRTACFVCDNEEAARFVC